MSILEILHLIQQIDKLKPSTISFIISIICIIIYIFHCSRNESTSNNKLPIQYLSEEDFENKTKSITSSWLKNMTNPFSVPPEKFKIPNLPYWDYQTIKKRVFRDQFITDIDRSNSNRPICPDLLEPIIPLSGRDKILMIGILTVENNCYRRQVLSFVGVQ